MGNLLNYKGYYAKVEYSCEDGILFGKIEGINDLVTFQSENSNEIEKEFQLAVDDYLAFCEDNNCEPDKVYKGTFNVRISPMLHKTISIYALKNSCSLNDAVEKAIAAYVEPKEMSAVNFMKIFNPDVASRLENYTSKVQLSNTISISAKATQN